MPRPMPGDHAEFYSTYTTLVPEPDVLPVLRVQPALLRETLGALDDEQARFRYQPGKWSVKEVVGHIVDAERVFSHRAFWFARDLDTPQPGMEQDPFVAAAGSDRRPLQDLLEDFDVARQNSVRLFESLDDDAWERRGVASDSPVTIRALAYILAGHVRHHLNVLEERYLSHGR